MNQLARTEDAPSYLPHEHAFTLDGVRASLADDRTIAAALRILEARFTRVGPIFDSPQSVKDYCRLELGGLEHEVFGCMFLDSQHRMIEFRRMFTGTLTMTSVYPREVVKAALAVNAGSVIFTHNHPSGSTEPSRADEYLTSTLKTALALIDVRVIDHMVVSATGCTSFAERGLL